jgi:DNA-binding NtrC family response regulator
MLRALQQVLAFRASVDVCNDFARARAQLLARAPDLLVTNSRLREYNGLQLVYLAASLELPMRAVVYGETDDLGAARDAQAAGAFYVPRQHIAAALPAYLSAELPSHDRRDVARLDRRQMSRGGRRATDPETQLAT